MVCTTDIDIDCQVFCINGLPSNVTQVNGIGRSINPFLSCEMSRIYRCVDRVHNYK